MSKTTSAKLRLGAALAVKAAIAAMSTAAVWMTAAEIGTGLFVYYTEDSNIFALLVCVLSAGFDVRALLSGKGVPRWVRLLEYMAACCLAVTLVVVLLVLAPMYGPGGYRIMLFDGAMLYHHFLCPVLMIALFVLLSDGIRIGRREALEALVPTLVYAAVSITLNFARVLHGPYQFLYVYEQPWYMSVMWFIVIDGGAYLLARLIGWGHGAAAGRIAE